MSRELTKDLLDLKDMVDKSIGHMLVHYSVANVATFWIYVDIDDDDLEKGGADDQPEFLAAVQEYIEACDRFSAGKLANARLVAVLTNGQEIILHQVGRFTWPDER